MVITKPMSNVISIHKKDSFYRTYTSRVTQNNINQNFLVSLFQQEIKKELEIRVFYLDQKCYAIAMLSQFDTQTSIDYRNYNYTHPNRFEFYSIPKELHEKIKLFMNHFNLQSGSLDFILDKQGEYIFLEVNPSGQYGLFNACNIYPDKLIAEYLLKKHYEHYTET
jgi:glutathione synthase/RimK-type ligase-like ATP-grasp enzyme